MAHNNDNDAFSAMKNLFPVSKTISFRGVPVGSTVEKMKEKRVLKDADDYAEYRQTVKVAGDRIIKDFINRSLRHASLKVHSDGSMDSIEEYSDLLFNETDRTKREKTLAAIGKKLKAKLAETYTETQKDFIDNLSKDKFFKEVLDGAALTAEERTANDAIKANTTYMEDYRKHRMQLFDPKFTGYNITNRCIDDNLPIHLHNCKVWEKIGPFIVDDLKPVFEHIKDATCAVEVGEMFTPEMFNVLLAQGDIEAYNNIIGGVSLSERKMLNGVNNIVQVYNSRAKKDEKLPAMKKLKKQILSDREPLSWLPEAIGDDNELRDIVESLINNYHTMCESVPADKATASPDLSLVFIDKKNLEGFSNAAYGRFYIAENAVIDELKRNNPKRPRKSPEKYEADIKKLFKKIDRFSLAYLDRCVNAYNPALCPDSASVLRNIVKNEAAVEVKIKEYRKILAEAADNDNPLRQNGSVRKATRILMDAMMELHHLIARYSLKDMPQSYDIAFYELVEEDAQNAKTFIKAYNRVRNYMTKKPYSTKKVRLYFGIPTLGKGWSSTKEYTNRILLFTEGNDIYFGIVPKSCSNLTRRGDGTLKEDILQGPGEQIQKVEMQYIPDAGKALGNMFFNANWMKEGEVRPSAELIALHDDLHDQVKSARTLTEEEKNAMIDYFKACIATVKHWEAFGFEFKPSEAYETLSDFYDNVTEQGLLMSKKDVSKQNVLDAVERGDLYLFRLDNQDMHKAHHGRDGNPTVWIREAVSCDPKAAIRLCGNVAMYYRKASLTRKVTHPAGVAMENKNPDNPRKTRTLSYDLVKNKRFTEDQFSFNIPITINYKADKRNDRSIVVNDFANGIIKEHPDMPVLGINRGERNLISYAVTAPDGHILEQGNFNVIGGFDFRELLAARERERKNNKQNWENINDIKNLKEGYMSLVVGEVVKLVQKYHCVIAMESLDNDFKNSRQKFERNVYSNFESSLARKLTLLTDKDAARRSSESLQLASNNTFGDFEVQNGILFQTFPWMISQTDPVTGFINRLSLFHKDNETSEEYLKKFESFRYNRKDDLFELTFDNSKVQPERETGKKKVWTICTYGERIENTLNENNTAMVDIHHDLTAEMKDLLDEAGIKYDAGRDILDKVAEKRSGVFYKAFFDLLRLTVRLSSWNNDLREYRIIGCTRDKDGRFYDSRRCPDGMPQDADVNAAWNIARRVHRILKNIREFNPKNPPLDENGKALKSPRKGVSQAEWFEMVQR